MKKDNLEIAIVGLGYVGLPLAIAFAKKKRVIGFDISAEKINKYKQGIDVTCEVGNEAIKNANIDFTSDPQSIKMADFVIVAVPTPVDGHNHPDLSPVIGATKTVAKNFKKGAIVVYESTVYPGVTEEVCVPILESESGLKCGIDFKVGYSPERINPGDKVHRLENITKIVSGMDEETLETVANVYEMVVEVGVFRASSIKVAEAAKVIENTQRDINIAFMNELSIIFNKLSIDTLEVLKAAGTKWNFLNFTPGLVGGHCIGVDPYYLTYKAQEVGYYPQVILSGRKINDGMGKHIAENVVKLLIKNNSPVCNAKVLIMGLTFKEDVPDVRNTKVVDIINELHDYGVKTFVTDPCADKHEALEEYGIEICEFDDVENVDAVILAVSHSQYKNLKIEDIAKKFRKGQNIFADIKGIYNKQNATDIGLNYWRL